MGLRKRYFPASPFPLMRYPLGRFCGSGRVERSIGARKELSGSAYSARRFWIWVPFVLPNFRGWFSRASWKLEPATKSETKEAFIENPVKTIASVIFGVKFARA